MTSSKSPVAGDLAAQEQERKRKKRGAIIKFSLAGVALVGIGAAATSAQWSDNAWFSASASAVGTVHLQASNDGTNFVDAKVVGDAVTIGVDSDFFAHLDQGADRTTTIYLKNAGTADLTIAADTPSLTGGIFGGAVPANVTVGTAPTTIAAGDTATISVELTTSATWPTSYQGTTGAITLHYSATAS